MTSIKFALFFASALTFQSFTYAQEWTSYQSPNKVNDLVDTGNDLLLATDVGLVVVNKTTLESETYTMANSDLRNNHIETITRGQNGSIWIGTYDVILSQFTGDGFDNPISPDIEPFDQFTQVYDLKVAPNGDLWVGTTDGVFHRQEQTWSHYDTAQFGPNFFEAWDIEILDNGEVFVGGLGIHQLVGDVWVDLLEGTQLEGYRSADLFTSTAGDLFFAGDLNEIGRFDGQTWQEYPIDFNGSEVVRFTEDTDGNVYFNTRQNGIFKLENDSWVEQTDEQTTAFTNITDAFYIDEQNNRWMTRNIHLSVNENGNIRSTLLADHTLETNSVQNIHMGDNGKMYFITGSQENFSVLDTDGNWSFLPKPPMARRFELFNDILALADDDIWVATNSGLYRFNGSEWTFTELEACRSFALDSKGRIYIRSDQKIYVADAGVISEITPDNSSLTSLSITGHGIDADDNLWIASGDFSLSNVIQMMSPTGEWTTYTATDHPVIKRPIGDFHFDAEGNVWIVNDPFGALKFDDTVWTDPIRENREAITTQDVLSITSNAEGKLYFANTTGISTLMDGEWENFINEAAVANNSLYTNIEFDDEGTLWWANSLNGVFSFKPEVVSSDFSPFESTPTEFKLFPNPAQAYSTLDFTTRANANVRVAIYNQIGQHVSAMDLGQLPGGPHRQEINIDRLPKGFYMVQLQINNSSFTRKLIIQ